MEPEHQVITSRDALLHAVRLNLEAGKLVSPFLIVFLIQVLLQDVDLLIERRPSAAVDLVLQDILVVIVRGRLDILRVILDRLVELAQLDTALHQPVQDRPSRGAAAVCAKKKRLAVLIALQRLIDLTDHDQRLYIPDPLPVDGIRNPRGAFIIPVRNQTVDLLQFLLIFPLVHCVTPL